jgi:CDP-paratose 2-epimerase
MGFGGHGLQTRDILHVQDLYDLVELQMEHFDSSVHQTFNVGGGVQNEVCLKQVTERCRRLTGTTLSIGPRPETHPADVPYYTTDNARVTAALGWVPKRGIDIVLEDIHTWIHQNIDLLRPVLEAKAA